MKEYILTFCLCIMIVLVFLSPSDNDLEFFTLNIITAATLAIWWAFHIRVPVNMKIVDERISKHRSLCLILLCYLLWVMFTLAGKQYLYNPMMHYGRLLAFGAVFYILILTPKVMGPDLFIKVISSTGIPVIITAVIEYYYYPSRIFPWRDARDYFNFFVGNANLLATFTCLLFIGAFIKMITAGQKRNKSAWLLMAVLSFLVFVMTRSRGGWLALIFCFPILIFVIFHYRETRMLTVNKKWIISLAAACLLITVIYSIPSPVNKNRYQIVERMEDAVTLSDVSTNARLLIWRVAGEMALAHPFKGVGYGRFAREYPIFRQGLIVSDPKISGIGPNRLPIAERERYAHNEILHVLAESGLIGLALFTAILCLVILPVIRLISLRGGVGKLPDIIFITAGLVLFLTHSLVDFTLFSCTNGLLFWIMLGLAVNLKE